MELRNYEVIMIASGDLTDDENKKAVDKFKELVENNGGKIATQTDWGRRKLAYEVNKQRYGIYNFYYMQANGEILEEMERQMGYDEQILKFFVTSVKDLNKAKADFEALKADPLKNAKLINDVIGA